MGNQVGVSGMRLRMTFRSNAVGKDLRRILLYTVLSYSKAGIIAFKAE